MSILYNRLKSVEKEKKPDVTLGEEEFPIDGEIKRQKEEQRRKRKLGIIAGIIAFLLVLFIGPRVISIKKGKPPAKEGKQLAKPAVKSAPPPVKKAEPERVKAPPPQKVVKPTKPPLEEPQKTLVEPVVLSVNLFEEGTKLYKQRRYSEAVTAYMKGLQQDPQTAVGYNNLGVVYYQQGRLKKAVAQLKIAVELNSHYAEAHYNLGVALEKSGQEKQALFHYLKFLEFAPSRHQALQEMVQTHVRYYY